MVRPLKMRRVGFNPNCTYFKPRGIPLANLEEVVLTKDTLEAVRFVDFEGLYQDMAAEKMGVSRQTIGRMVEQARKIIADALLNGKAIKIEDGNVQYNQTDNDLFQRGGRRRGVGWKRR